ncbi:MAG: ATP synthase F1 subunit delta [Oscillospiraceae bacterium]|nr:ATP synthase F1 subunit delta [Oscillospiraceae bacterium]
MNKTAMTYGHALFELAQEEGKLDEFMTDLKVISHVLQENPQFLALYDSRNIPLAERLGALDECFGGQVAPYIVNFLKILCQNGLMEILPHCIEHFRSLYNNASGILEVKVVSAIKLLPALQDKLRAKLQDITGKTVVLICTEDPNVLGGLRLDLGGTELDGTIRRKLDEFGKDLSQLVL